MALSPGQKKPGEKSQVPEKAKSACALNTQKATKKEKQSKKARRANIRSDL